MDPSSSQARGEGRRTAADVGPDLTAFYDVPVHIEAVGASSAFAIEDLVRLRPGMTVVLDQTADGTLDLLINGEVAAHGEIVNLAGRLGVRVLSLSAAQQSGPPLA